MAKISEETKVKLVYSGELAIFSIVFLVLGILKITGVMAYDEGRRQIFNYITTAGGVWLVVDLLWAAFSKVRRQRICLLDKFLNVPLGIFLLVFNIICFTQPKMDDSFYINMMSVVFFYVAIDYAFQAIYHFYKPLPSLMEEIRNAEALEKEENHSIPEDNQDEIK